MLEFLTTMAPAGLACLVLAAIHVYLGIHVLARKVIFVDLALAQIAALGGVVATVMGYGASHSPWISKGFALGFTLVGALLFSFTRTKHEKVPHEAIIGICYAVALSLAILASAQLAHGADELRELLSGNILWVDYQTVGQTAVLYLIIGAIHFRFRKQFLLQSFQPAVALEQGQRIRMWDFAFYGLFGIVVTSSVSIAGVLLVFSLLVIPAVAAALLQETLPGRFLVGFLVASVASTVGIVVSYFGDLPTGPSVVVTLAASLVVVALVRRI